MFKTNPEDLILKINIEFLLSPLCYKQKDICPDYTTPQMVGEYLYIFFFILEKTKGHKIVFFIF